MFHLIQLQHPDGFHEAGLTVLEVGLELLLPRKLSFELAIATLHREPPKRSYQNPVWDEDSQLPTKLPLGNGIRCCPSPILSLAPKIK